MPSSPLTPDQDHIGGLETLVENLRVDVLFMHDPDKHPDRFWKGSAFDLSSGSNHLAHAVTKSLSQSRSLIESARSHHVLVREPFAGMRFLGLHFLGPTEDYYTGRLRAMSRDSKLGELAHDGLEKKAIPTGTARESFEIETLTESTDASPSNNTSVVSLLAVEGKKVLFTGDAGPDSLRPAITRLRELGVASSDLDAVQVPHHGSRYNVTPSVLDDLLGPVTRRARGVAFASVAPSNPSAQFPAKQVTNAFHRRGYPVVATAGRNLTCTFDDDANPLGSDRDLDPVALLPLYEVVETFNNG